jgi:hypothetical protein
VVVSVLYLLFRRALAVAALRFRSAEFKELGRLDLAGCEHRRLRCERKLRAGVCALMSAITSGAAQVVAGRNR